MPEPGYAANQDILRVYGNGGATLPHVAVLTAPIRDRIGERRADVAAAFAGLSQQPGTRVVSYGDTDDRRLVSADGRSTYGLIFTPAVRSMDLGGPDLGPEFARSLTESLPADWTVHVTSLSELAAGGDAESPGLLTETLLGAAGALAVLLFVFASFLATVPLVIAAVSILTTFLLILGVTYLTDVSFIVQFLVALIGLGIAIDYSLLLVTRWREELARGHQGAEAVHRAMETAGRAVLFSGVTVAIGLVSMVFLSVPFLRSTGYAGVLIPLVSVAVTLTLLPIVLTTIGRRLDWPRLRKETHASRGWSAWARGAVRLRWPAALAGLALLVPLGAAGLGLQLGTPKADSLATSGPAYEGLRALETAGIPAGVLTPMEVLAPAGADPAAVAARLAAVQGVHAAVAPTAADWRIGGTAVISVLPAAESSTDEGKAAIAAVRAAVDELPGVQVGGGGPLDVDFERSVYGSFPLMLGIIALLTYLLLARAFRSLLLPLKAVLLNLLSVGAVYGALVLVWQDGYGSNLWGIPATGSVNAFVPLMVFAFLYGLSMDYEVFIVGRMREEYDRTGSTTTAIVEGIGRTGRLVTSGSLVMFAALIALASGPIVSVKVFATGLGVGVLLDATVVRALLVPATMSLFGRWNWWLPGWAARLLRISPSPAHAAPARTDSSHLNDREYA